MKGPLDILPADSRGDPSEVALGDAVGVECLARPGNDTEVAEVVRMAGREGLTVLPIGTGRHLHGVVSAERAAVLCTERLEGIRIYEPADLTLTAGAGTPLSDLRSALAPHDQWLPFDPPDADGRTLGGLVASGLSGPLAAGYGALRNHVLGATVVLGDGRVVRLGGRVVKNVAGFDLLRPMVGSLGGLGVLTEICVRLFPLPHTQHVLLMRGDTPGALVGAARAVARARVMPAAAMVVGGVPELDGKAALIVRLHGAASSVQADGRTFQDVMGGRVEVREGDEAAALLSEVRDVPYSAIEASGTGVGVVSTLPARMGEVLTALRSALGSVPLSMDVMGGVGRFAFAPDQSSALVELRRIMESLGGSLGIERLPGDRHDLDGAVSTVGAGEAALSERIRAVFDSPGVFWRARRTGSGRGPATAAGGWA